MLASTPIERGLRRRRIEQPVTCRAADGPPAPQFSRRQPMLKTNGLGKSQRSAYRRRRCNAAFVAAFVITSRQVQFLVQFEY